MYQRSAIYVRTNPDQTGTSRELLGYLQQAIDARGDLLVATYCDDARLTGKGRNTSWRRLLADLDTVQQIVLTDAGDLPGKTVTDILCVLATLTAHSVTVAVPTLGIDTGAEPAAVLSLIREYRAAKKSAAIRAGQDRARAAGRHVGRPPISPIVRRKIMVALLHGDGVRITARRFSVSPALVVAIRHEMAAEAEQQAA
jgi:hypothetical protein